MTDRCPQALILFHSEHHMTPCFQRLVMILWHPSGARPSRSKWLNRDQLENRRVSAIGTEPLPLPMVIRELDAKGITIHCHVTGKTHRPRRDRALAPRPLATADRHEHWFAETYARCRTASARVGTVQVSTRARMTSCTA